MINLNYILDEIARSGLIDQTKLTLAEFVSDSSPRVNFYLNYPYLFNDYFEFSNEGALDLLSAGGYWTLLSILYSEKIFDEQDIDQTNNILLYQYCSEQAIMKFANVFDWKSEFWKEWERVRAVFQKYIVLQNKIDYRNIGAYDFSIADFDSIAISKSVHSRVVLHALDILSNKISDLKSISEIHDKIYVMLQIFDDINDVHEDLMNGQTNRYLYRAISMNILSFNTIKDMDSVQFFLKMHSEGCMDEDINKAFSYLDDIKAFCSGANLMHLLKMMSAYEERARKDTAWVYSLR